MSKFHMKILSQYMEPIKRGQKVREYRLNDSFRQKIKIGDTLVLVVDTINYINVTVLGLKQYESWESALKDHWEVDFHFSNKTFSETLDECKSYYADDLVNKFGIIVYDIKPQQLEVNKSRILMDANTIINREIYFNNNNSEINRLYKWFDKIDVVKFVHPKTKNELSKHKNANLFNLTTYETLAPIETTDKFFSNIMSKYSENENSIVDDKLINQVYNRTVDYLITEDSNILNKASELYLRNQILTVSEMLKTIEQENPQFIDYEILSVKRKKFQQVNIEDAFFDSLKIDYPDFEDWFKRKSQEQAYVFEHNGKVVGFLYIKIENENENYINFSPIFEPKKRLKIGTFKVDKSGFRLGERYLKIIFDNAQAQNVDEIYMTLFDKKRPEMKYLIDIVERWGFVKHGYKSDNNELIMVKSFRDYDTTKNTMYNFPLIKENPRFFILPIEPQYHTDLFPDFILKTENMQNYIENLPHRYSLEKIYISGAEGVTAKSGDVILIYRKGLRNPKKYSSVITGIAILVDVKRHKNVEQFMKSCKNKTLFKDSELKEFYMHKNWKTVIKLINDQSFTNKVLLEYLRKINIVDSTSGPRPFHEISKWQFKKITEKGGIEWEKY